MMIAHGLQQFLSDSFLHIDFVLEKKSFKIHIKNIQLLLVELGFCLLSLIGTQFA